MKFADITCKKWQKQITASQSQRDQPPCQLILCAFFSVDVNRSFFVPGTPPGIEILQALLPILACNQWPRNMHTGFLHTLPGTLDRYLEIDRQTMFAHKPAIGLRDNH